VQESSASQDTEGDVLIGARAIGEALGLTERQAHYALEKGYIAGAKKFGRKWIARRHFILRPFSDEAA